MLPLIILAFGMHYAVVREVNFLVSSIFLCF
jgi:hypothetical protein